MSNPCVHHRPMPTTVGLSLGYLGVIGLVVSLLSLVPINLYNLYLITSTMLCTPQSLVLMVFLTGSGVSSLLTIGGIVTACLIRPRLMQEDMEANCTKKVVGFWPSRLVCLLVVAQISWAVFGTHLVWFVKSETPQIISLSVWILWLNYGILLLFSFVLFCASFFIIIGTSTLANHQSGVGEMHQPETTPLLNKSTYSHRPN